MVFLFLPQSKKSIFRLIVDFELARDVGVSRVCLIYQQRRQLIFFPADLRFIVFIF